MINGFNNGKLFADLKTVYGAVNEDEVYENLLSMREKWGYNWDNPITFLAFPYFIRKIMYTTNIIESLHSQFRKVTKTKRITNCNLPFLYRTLITVQVAPQHALSSYLDKN